MFSDYLKYASPIITAAATATPAAIRSSTIKAGLSSLVIFPDAEANLRVGSFAVGAALVEVMPMDIGPVSGPAGALPVIFGAKGERVTLNAGLDWPGVAGAMLGAALCAGAGAGAMGAPLKGDFGAEGMG